ncbi:hypothetical protein AUEXF2481DRAFT_635740 [Aureobasidium subglaciale EXF-2481]|uniref:Uncharacterized protein n=1 Tax=Aureobasidium subglaciale (strain EXF-2481) TaxID=1043005 RepID=A0A074YJW9_AURSE|nr:uncharacterized protein AUEXF2481DRAFT_635740 [Aureobasidium subglaciale EXF-2481]KEQ96374.1 hypothetical protein AUEXF2481DRAFT_635740 [Aureobasidium subglaciale EXF-2481]
MTSTADSALSTFSAGETFCLAAAQLEDVSLRSRFLAISEQTASFSWSLCFVTSTLRVSRPRPTWANFVLLWLSEFRDWPQFHIDSLGQVVLNVDCGGVGTSERGTCD